MTVQTDAALLCSGGMDSITLAYWLINKGILFEPIFINYGQHCVQTELSSAIDNLPADISKKIRQIDVSDIYRGSSSRLIEEANLWTDSITYKDMYLPYRSQLLITIGSAYAQSKGYKRLYAGFINSNHAQEIDCSTRYMKTMAKILSEYGGVKLILPFRDYSKFQVAKIGIDLKAPIGKTFSCQASSKIPCGACPNCVDRLEALKQLSRESQ